ncbi:unnamed protein product [Coffea canephora]|uniref:Seven-in-absentia protein TRAF-like domain-containing protein n=1 Tax=Coffea canephora TaxID=49390 RepID=A0A068UY02_COFCA|nr:unnamed protein product [Coffea canephora]
MRGKERIKCFYVLPKYTRFSWHIRGLPVDFIKCKPCLLFLSAQVFNCFGHQFCLYFEAFHLGTAPVYMAFLRFMGTDEDAEKFCYSLEVGGKGRKLTWQGVPRSIRNSHITVRDSLDGLIIYRSMALYFSGGNMKELKLKVSGRIWRKDM